MKIRKKDLEIFKELISNAERILKSGDFTSPKCQEIKNIDGIFNEGIMYGIDIQNIARDVYSLNGTIQSRDTNYPKVVISVQAIDDEYCDDFKGLLISKFKRSILKVVSVKMHTPLEVFPKWK